MQHKRQFKGTKAPRIFFDRLVRHTGDTLSLSLGKVLPKNWSYVRIEIVDREADSITLKVTKLLEMRTDASDSTAHPTGKQNA